ncbi:hypothetical protein [Marinobacter alexandrii]|uniref:hypothetical protein n=1 Tax=Marinobacter alexandrii TaxID=2570351 RepID=UPI0011084A90|nr:hypothetical protein [Marinobacter alexandrii]
MAITIPAGRVLPIQAKAGGGFQSVGLGGWLEGQPPTISSISGTFTAGQVATISVGNLSTKRNGQLAFINFEAETAGQVVTSIQHANLDPGFQKYECETAGSLFGSKYARCHAIQTRPDQAGIVFDQPYREIFFEGWTRYQVPDFVAVGDAQIKFWRLVPYSTIGADAQGELPRLTWTREDGNGFLLNVDPGPSGQAAWYGSTPLTNVWEPWSGFMKMGDLNTANGKIYAKVGAEDSFTFSGFPGGHAASPDGSIASSEWDGNEYQIDDGLLQGEIHRLLVPYYTRSDQETILDIDRIFANDSPERVVVGDASTFTACTPGKRFILKQNGRSGGQIEVDIDSLGPLATGPVYAYVVNSDGLYNTEGYLWRAS